MSDLENSQDTASLIPKTGPNLSLRLKCLIVLLAVLTVFSLVWPVYRAFLHIEINANESWNAFHADKAVRGEQLYPDADELVVNNYPPLSFLITGLFGRLLGDTILAGRLLSVFAIGMIGYGTIRTILFLTGSRLAGWVGGLSFVASMGRFFSSYAGMNDPQLLAQGVMLLGFSHFLRAVANDRGLLLSSIIMVAAGFMKHNIVMLPIVAAIWLCWQRPRRFMPWLIQMLVVVGLGFAVCHMVYGPAFLQNMLSPRSKDWLRLKNAIGAFQWHAVGLVAWLYVGIARRKVLEVQLCNLLVIVGIALYHLQCIGDGVGDNCQFDMLIAVSIATGVAMAQAQYVLTRLRTAEQLCSGFVLALCLRLVALPNAEAIQLFVDPRFQNEITTRLEATTASVAAARAVPGDVYAPSYLCYYAGKKHTVDFFNLDQRIRAGLLPPDVVEQRIAAGRLVRIDFNPTFNWGNPVK